MVKKCNVKGCNSESYGGCGISFFKIPSNETRKKEWLNAIEVNLVNNAVVCSRHFRPEDIINYFSKSNLKESAIPSIFPGDNPPEEKKTVRSNLVNQSVSQELELQTSTEESFNKPISIYAEPSCILEENSLPSPSEQPLQCVNKTKELQREVKILRQRIKRRDVKIQKLQNLLNVLKKKFRRSRNHYKKILMSSNNLH